MLPIARSYQPSPAADSPEELAATLQKAAGNLDTPEDVGNMLFAVFSALAEGRITERRAGIFCYIAQTLLHSCRAIAQKKKQKPRERAPISMIFPRRPATN